LGGVPVQQPERQRYEDGKNSGRQQNQEDHPLPLITRSPLKFRVIMLCVMVLRVMQARQRTNGKS
jgi:hypothetical protein